MLSFEQMQIIYEQTQKENADEFVKELILEYCKSEVEMNKLLELIPKIAETGLLAKQRKIFQYSWATELLLAERFKYPIPKRKSKSRKEFNPDFPTLLYVAKAHFPNGNCDKCSVSEKAFWQEFIDCLKDKQGFDYDNTNDWKWIQTTAGCESWMTSVIHQNIDENWVQPK